jgi:hypothetical protein
MMRNGDHASIGRASPSEQQNTLEYTCMAAGARLSSEQLLTSRGTRALGQAQQHKP